MAAVWSAEAVAGGRPSGPCPPKRPKGGPACLLPPPNTTWVLLRLDGFFGPEGPKKAVVAVKKAVKKPVVF